MIILIAINPFLCYPHRSHVIITNSFTQKVSLCAIRSFLLSLLYTYTQIQSIFIFHFLQAALPKSEFSLQHPFSPYIQTENKIFALDLINRHRPIVTNFFAVQALPMAANSMYSFLQLLSYIHFVIKKLYKFL